MSISSFAKAHKITSIFVGIFLVLLLLALFFAQSNKIAPIRWGLWEPVNSTEGVALQGHDPVAYQQNNESIAGNPSLSHTWNGASWHFSNIENQQLFKANPNDFAPQYGGYCATAVGEGLTADINPEIWYLHDGKLYLFFDEGAKNDWVTKIEQRIIAQADQNWSKR